MPDKATYLRNSVLATIIYYDIFDYPLTLVEIYKYLINPGRLSMIKGGIGEIKLSDISDELDKLVDPGTVNEKNGFYFLSGRSDLYELRIERDKISARKWKKFLSMVKFLALAPYLRGVFASGSMAINNTTEESDFDVLVIIRSGRLYTCRFFLWAISSFLGIRRKKNRKIAPDKLCFNHYITDDNLYINHESIFNAQTYINLKPAMIKSEIIDRFYVENIWLNNFAYNFHTQKNFVGRSVKPPIILLILAKALEFILNFSFGDTLERVFKYGQQKRIKSDPITYESGGRIIFTDQELEFHPHSFERIVIEKYRTNLKRFGIVPYIDEEDSGLT
ncbi:MAG: hypothetical protein Q7S43_00105 [bacterium]|nr:hypothetical protein [bacterium]